MSTFIFPLEFSSKTDFVFYYFSFLLFLTYLCNLFSCVFPAPSMWPQEKCVSETFSSYAQVGISCSYSNLCVYLWPLLCQLSVAMCFHDVLASICYVSNSGSLCLCRLPVCSVYNGTVNLTCSFSTLNCIVNNMLKISHSETNRMDRDKWNRRVFTMYA